MNTNRNIDIDEREINLDGQVPGKNLLYVAIKPLIEYEYKYKWEGNRL